MASMDDVLKMLTEMKGGMDSITDRLGALEDAKGDAEVKKEDQTPKDADEHTLFTPVREKQLTKHFGTDTSSAALLEFLDHYKLCVEMNQQRKVPGWGDAKYRARELRFQLQGEAGVYVRQEEAMQEDWVFDDERIIEKLKERWLNRDCIELDIINFEEARQTDNESLGQFMDRLKGLGHRAFSEFDSKGMQQRIIWRFLDGVRDKDIRSSIIKERWMADRKTPKPYSEVLKIAETAHLNKVAASATGMGQPSKKIAVMSNRDGLSKDSTPRGSRGGKVVRGTSRGSVQAAGTQFACFYCNETHPGGWRSCEERKRKNPNWKPPSTRGGGNSSEESSQSGTTSPSDSNASTRSGQAFQYPPSQEI